jgi:hypothetical protein
MAKLYARIFVVGSCKEKLATRIERELLVPYNVKMWIQQQATSN